MVPANAMSIDHIIRKEDGGASIDSNAQVTHPYCNTGYKEHMAHLARMANIAQETVN